MKKLQGIGKLLSKAEQRQIIGGYDDDPPPGPDAECFWTMNPTLPGCAGDTGTPIRYTCGDPWSSNQAQMIADGLCSQDNCCVDVDCIYCGA
jgi:hypothetical protein